MTYMKELIVHNVNITHARLIELTKLADQAKSYYNYIERIAKIVTSDHRNLNDILMSASKDTLKEIFIACYDDRLGKKPNLYDGIGKPYSPSKACYFFLAWMIRDAPAQRLRPLISRMIKEAGQGKLSQNLAQIDTFTELFYEYRTNVKSFSWEAIREVVVDRLEGSRRSHAGHIQETVVRTALATAIQNYYNTYLNYGAYDNVVIENKQIKIATETVDIAVALVKNGVTETRILIPVKTRETQGGGHAYLFSRDLITAIQSIKQDESVHSYVAPFIIAENWDMKDLESIKNLIAHTFYYNINPNRFQTLTDEQQIEINRFIAQILGNTHVKK